MRSVPIYLSLAVLMSIPTYGGPDSAGIKDECETVGRRVYDLCMARPMADRETCLREYDEAYLRCKPRQPTEDTKLPPTDPERSKNVYRIPYADGTTVRITRDFEDHNPRGKIDMVGKGPGTHRIVAAADGTVRFIQDSRTKQQHPERWLRNMEECNNNYVWIQHANGEWSKYSHMQQFTTTGKARLRVGDTVKRGQYLGDEGKVGCAWPAHLHFEIVKKLEKWEPAIGDKASGQLANFSWVQNRNPVIAGVPGETFKDGETYVVNAPPTCKKDSDCVSGYCDAGVDFTKNACRPLKADNETCATIGGGSQCRSGQCRFGRCYTPNSVSIGGTCYMDDACRSGKCSDIDGARGECVCNDDLDCGSGRYCDGGLDLKVNTCRNKLNIGQKCGKLGSVGNDHKCKSGKCSGFPKYECK